MARLRLQARRDLTPMHAKYCLITIILIGAFLRFFRLGFPSARTDEGFTYWRTCGTFNELFDTLRLDAFVPLHYEFVWLLTKLLGPWLWVYRLPGAIFGMLMPLAVYLLARTIFNRRVAVISALLAMSSTYFSFYVRDAKMYMPAWCLTTFASAFAFRYIVTGARINWLSYVFFGIASAGTHSLTLLPLSLITLAGIGIRGHQKIKRIVLILLGLLSIGVAPFVYYQTFNRWFQVSGGFTGVPKANIEEAPHDNGLMWVESFQGHYGTQGVFRQSLSAYLFGFEYPPTVPDPDPNHWGSYEAWKLYRICLIVLPILILIAIITRIILKSRTSRGRLIWIGAVMVALPIYGFYLRSFDTLSPLWEIAEWYYVIIVLGLIAAFIYRNNWRSLIWLIGSIALLTAAWIAAKYAHAHSTVWNHLWVPRYAAFITPMLLVLIAGALDRLPTRVFAWTMIGAFAGVNLVGSIAHFTFRTGWPDEIIARDAALTLRNDNTLVGGTIFLPARAPIYPMVFKYYHLAAASNWEMNPAGFRNGNQWPFRPGPEAEKMLASMRIISHIPRATPASFPPNVNHVILWSSFKPGSKTNWNMYGWKLIRQDEYLPRAAWTWDVGSSLLREEYVRENR